MDIDNRPTINYNILADAIKFYGAGGFEYIETPWILSKDTLNITAPSPKTIIETSYDNFTTGLVGSAEQGFFELANNNALELNKSYVSAGPCFRDEGVIDAFHQPTFMKVELFKQCETYEIAESSYLDFVMIANKFMDEARLIKTTDGHDLEINGIEVGSYGTRYHPSFGFCAFGTGVAEPRFSLATAYKTKEKI